MDAIETSPHGPTFVCLKHALAVENVTGACSENKTGASTRFESRGAWAALPQELLM